MRMRLIVAMAIAVAMVPGAAMTAPADGQFVGKTTTLSTSVANGEGDVGTWTCLHLPAIGKLQLTFRVKWVNFNDLQFFQPGGQQHAVTIGTFNKSKEQPSGDSITATARMDKTVRVVIEYSKAGVKQSPKEFDTKMTYGCRQS